MKPDLEYSGLKKLYDSWVDKSFELYLFNVWQLLRVAAYSRKDQSNRRSKHLPSDEDLSFTSKIFDNPLIQSIEQSEAFQREIKKRSIHAKTNADIIKMLYTDFAKTDDYKKYLEAEISPESHIDVLLKLYKHCYSGETFEEYNEDLYDTWIHDKSLIIGAMKKTIKGLPVLPDFYSDFIPGKETVEDFGDDLLYKVCHLEGELFSYIEPALKNWEADRVAIIDMILLKLALAEMLYFETIPTKVTLNEYVDISKLYSTPKSKDFINGILDRLMKKLQKDGKIQKSGRGLID